MPRPADPVGALWLAATVLREHRGDGHVLAGVAHGLRGLDATVTFAATGAITRAMIQPTRGWTDEDWAQLGRRLQARGLLDTGGRLTKTGGALRRDVEDLTDRLAAGPVERLGSTGVERAIELAAPVSRHLMDTGVIPDAEPGRRAAAMTALGASPRRARPARPVLAEGAGPGHGAARPAGSASGGRRRPTGRP